MNLFEYAEQQQKNQPPQPGHIVLKRQGISDCRGGRVPGGYVEIAPHYSGGWYVNFEYKRGDEFWAGGAKGKFASYEDAVSAAYRVAAEHSPETFTISPCVEAYCPTWTKEGDWYRAAVLLDGDKVVTPGGEIVAQLGDGCLVVVDEKWRAQIERVSGEYAKSQNQRCKIKEVWATWLLGEYMRDEGAPFVWVQDLSTGKAGDNDI